MTTIDQIHAFLAEHKLNSGGEPEYLCIKSPITDDPAGWYVGIIWMHHDGDIVEIECRDEDLETALQVCLDTLKARQESMEEFYQP